MKGSLKYTATINKRKDVKRRRLYESSFDRKVSNFKLLMKNGPFFICVICNRCLYRTSVICFNIEKYSADENIIFMVKSYDDNYYICTTCDKVLCKISIPCQAVANGLNVVELPKLFQDIRGLERLLASIRNLFKKVTVMPKGKSLKIKGSICNIPVSEVDSNCNKLPRPADSNDLIIVKLKRKLDYKGHIVFEAIRPDIVIQFLGFLRRHNDLYSDIEINPANIQVDILGLHRFKTEEDAIYSKLVKCLDEPVEM